jgi:hypothetical protein
VGFSHEENTMPEWGQPPKVAITSALESIREQLSKEVADNPPFEEVTGVSQTELGRHALEAVAAFSTNHQLDDADSMVKLYILGFIVGAKYGEQRMSRSPD